jgi:hypothetical protein
MAGVVTITGFLWMGQPGQDQRKRRRRNWCGALVGAHGQKRAVVAMYKEPNLPLPRVVSGTQ